MRDFWQIGKIVNEKTTSGHLQPIHISVQNLLTKKSFKEKKGIKLLIKNALPTIFHITVNYMNLNFK